MRAGVETPQAPVEQATVYDFHTVNGDWTLGLTADFISLKTTAYTTREQFLEHLTMGVDAFLECYPHIDLFTRIGLRYVDEVDRAALGLGDHAWADLLRRSILGVLADQPNGIPVDDVAEFSARTMLKLPGDRSVRIRHGLSVQDESPRSFMIDTDFFTNGPVEIHEWKGHIEYFSAQAGNLFRWVASETLKNALNPTPV